VLDAGPDGLHRVVLGIFDRRRAAKRAQAALRRAWGLDGFVREP
jgi:cell division septation protein DedD